MKEHRKRQVTGREVVFTVTNGNLTSGHENKYSTKDLRANEIALVI